MDRGTNSMSLVLNLMVVCFHKELQLPSLHELYCFRWSDPTIILIGSSKHEKWIALAQLYMDVLTQKYKPLQQCQFA